MYNRNGNNASGFWIVVGGVLVALMMVYSMSWSLDDIEARAHRELSENPEPHITDARAYLMQKIADDHKYHQRIASGLSTWKIEIIGTMPPVIGTCFYREVSNEN